jgi:hypothetical protein
MPINKFAFSAITIIAALIASGCTSKQEPEYALDCNRPRTEREQQQCTARKAFTENRIEPTKNPKNWLDIHPRQE